MGHRLNATVRDENVVVHFDYQPSESQTMEHPGCAESVDITWVTFEGEMWDIKCILHDEYISSLETDCLESMGQ